MPASLPGTACNLPRNDRMRKLASCSTKQGIRPSTDIKELEPTGERPRCLFARSGDRAVVELKIRRKTLLLKRET